MWHVTCDMKSRIIREMWRTTHILTYFSYDLMYDPCVVVWYVAYRTPAILQRLAITFIDPSLHVYLPCRSVGRWHNTGDITSWYLSARLRQWHLWACSSDQKTPASVPYHAYWWILYTVYTLRTRRLVLDLVLPCNAYTQTSILDQLTTRFTSAGGSFRSQRTCINFMAEKKECLCLLSRNCCNTCQRLKDLCG